MSKRFSVINFKGGVGKTTLTFQMASRLSSINNKKVLICDVDHQSSLSITVLGGKNWDRTVKDHKTIDQIFTSMTKSSALPGKEIIHHAEGELGKIYPNLDIVPSALSLDETEIDLTGSVVGNPIESEWRKRTLICEWLSKNSIDKIYDYIVFDCPPATKIVTQNALAASHGYLVPTIPDAVSVRGTPHLTEQMMGKIEKQFTNLSEYLKTKGQNVVDTFVPHRAFIGIVITRIKTSGPSFTGYTLDASANLKALQKLYDENTFIKPMIEEGVGVSESLSRSLPVYDLKSEANISGRGFDKTFADLTVEIKRRVDSL